MNAFRTPRARVAAWLALSALAGIGAARDASAQEPPSPAGAPLTLLAATAAALERHPAVHEVEARRAAADADVAAARASRLPSVSLDASLTRFQEPMIVAPLHGLDPSSPPLFDETLVQGAARLRFAVFDGGEGSARSRAAHAALDAADSGGRAREMALIEEVAAAYLQVLAARAVREAAGARLAALEAEHDRAVRNVAAGSAASVEALRASAALEEARADAASTRTRAAVAERDLARTMGEAAGSLADRPLADVRVSPASTEGAAGFPPAPTAEAQGVAGPDLPGPSPAVARADAELRASEARLEERRSRWLPRLDLVAGLLDFGTVTGDHVLEWQAGIQLSWPVFTGGGRRASVRRAEADLALARASRDAVVLDTDAAIDRARAAVEEAETRTAALGASVAQWTEVTRIEALALAAGSGVQTDLLAAEAGLFRARAGHADARYRAALAHIGLARALGTLDRGWLARALETVP